jgi:hypothetical protein
MLVSAARRHRVKHAALGRTTGAGSGDARRRARAARARARATAEVVPIKRIE